MGGEPEVRHEELQSGSADQADLKEARKPRYSIQGGPKEILPPPAVFPDFWFWRFAMG